MWHLCGLIPMGRDKQPDPLFRLLNGSWIRLGSVTTVRSRMTNSVLGYDPAVIVVTDRGAHEINFKVGEDRECQAYADKIGTLVNEATRK